MSRENGNVTYLYRPANDPQKIPGPEMVTLTVIKKWTELKNLGNGFIPFFFLL